MFIGLKAFHQNWLELELFKTVKSWFISALMLSQFYIYIF